jgi:hypothetical protein
MLCQMLALGISFVALMLFASAKARDGADDKLFRRECRENSIGTVPWLHRILRWIPIRQIRRPREFCKTHPKFYVTLKTYHCHWAEPLRDRRRMKK